MKKEYLPYYISRAILSLAFALLVSGLNWYALLVAVILFGLFLLYIHSGWFQIDLEKPLTPLRRDPYGQSIQRKALIIAVSISLISYALVSVLSGYLSIGVIPGNVYLILGIVLYLFTQFFLFCRTEKK
jgi:hypothetical protein